MKSQVEVIAMNKHFSGTSRKSTGALKDTIILCLVAIVIPIVAAVSHVYTLFSAWYQQFGAREIGFLLTLCIMLPLAFSIFTLRRWIELRSEVIMHKQEKEQLAYLSTHDPLTGLYNRAYFDEELSRLQRGRQFPISLVMADVDQLKAANDTGGHAAGDALLRGTAELLKATFRAEDVVARIGGDEFAALMPNTDAEAAEQVKIRIEKMLLANNPSRGAYHLRLSIGVATAEKETLLAETLRHADACMYRDKLTRRRSNTRELQARDEHLQKEAI